MDIVLENPKSLNPKVSIKLKSEDYTKNVENTLKSYRKQVSLKGFRKGNVPMGMVKKMYGKQVVFDEINNMLSKALNDYIKEKELNILGEPLVDESALLGFDFDNPGDIDISYELGLIPDLDHSYKTDKISKHVVEISEITLEKMIGDLTIKHGTVEAAENLSEKQVHNEIIMNGLRTNIGIPSSCFDNSNGIPFHKWDAFLEKKNGAIFLKSEYFHLADEIIIDLMALD